MGPKIPDRWLDYKACGRIIAGTRIICFKVPLDETFQVKSSMSWTVKALLDKIPKLGAVIDLTNTHRYYDPKILLSAGVQHTKILLPGHVIPPESKVREFMDVVDKYLEKDDESLVGVHCTHGLNRTGYMVGLYMRDRLGMLPKDAIKRFEIARGYKMERQNYIAQILGKPPPPPDFGKETIVVPIQENRKRQNSKQSRRKYTHEENPDEDTEFSRIKRRRRSDRSFDYKNDY